MHGTADEVVPCHNGEAMLLACCKLEQFNHTGDVLKIV